MTAVDDYIQTVIARGDEGSKLLRALTAPTLKNQKLVEIITDGITGIELCGITASTGGNVKYSGKD